MKKMTEKKLTAEYLKEMVKKSFSNVDIDEKGKMCVLPLQSLVDTVDLYEKVIADQKAEIERLTEYCGMFERGEIGSPMTTDKMLALEKEKIELQKQVGELKSENTELYKEHTTLIAGSILRKKQVQKDTAKEIIQWIKRNGTLQYGGYVIHDSTIEQMCKKYGVEVE